MNGYPDILRGTAGLSVEGWEDFHKREPQPKQK